MVRQNGIGFDSAKAYAAINQPLVSLFFSKCYKFTSNLTHCQELQHGMALIITLNVPHSQWP